MAEATVVVNTISADRIGVDDGSPLYHWVYDQRRSKTYGVEVEITARQEREA